MSYGFEVISRRARNSLPLAAQQNKNRHLRQLRAVTTTIETIELPGSQETSMILGRISHQLTFLRSPNNVLQACRGIMTPLQKHARLDRTLLISMLI